MPTTHSQTETYGNSLGLMTSHVMKRKSRGDKNQNNLHSADILHISASVLRDVLGHDNQSVSEERKYSDKFVL